MLAAPGRMALNWPYMIMPGTYRESKARGGFNILCEHAVYSERIISKLMPSDTEYTTIVRKPLSRLKTAFNFFHVDWRADIHSDEPLQEYLSDIRRYEIHIRSPSHQRPYRLRQSAIGTSYGEWHCSGAAYLLACIALLTLRAAHAKYGETRCTISSCLAL